MVHDWLKLITARKRSGCHSVPGVSASGGEGGGSASWGVCIRVGSASTGGLHRGDLHLGRVWQTPPLHRILRDTVNERAVRILLECILFRKAIANSCSCSWQKKTEINPISWLVWNSASRSWDGFLKRFFSLMIPSVPELQWSLHVVLETVLCSVKQNLRALL